MHKINITSRVETRDILILGPGMIHSTSFFNSFESTRTTREKEFYRFEGLNCTFTGLKWPQGIGAMHQQNESDKLVKYKYEKNSNGQFIAFPHSQVTTYWVMSVSSALN